MEKKPRVQFPIRMTELEKQELTEAASRENLPVGTWVRMIALREARRQKVLYNEDGRRTS